MHPLVRSLRKCAAPFVLSNLALALIVAIAYRFHLKYTTVVLLSLVVIVLHGLLDGFVASVLFSIIAAACIVYFFVPPLFTFRFDDPVDLTALGIFLIISNGLTWLVSNAYGALRAAHMAVWDRDLRTNVISFS